MSLRTIQETLSSTLASYMRLQVNQRLYVNAFVVLIAYLTDLLVLGPAHARDVLLLFFVFLAAAVCYDLLSLYKKIYETLVGKAALLVLVSLCTNFAVVLASQVVNDVTGVDPSRFPHTVALLVILTIPLFASVVLGVLFVLLIFITPFLLMFYALPDEQTKAVLLPGYSTPKPTPFAKTTRVVQFVSMVVFCAAGYGLFKSGAQSYESFLAKTARSFLFQWEMYPKASCSLEPGAKAAFLGDEKLLIATMVPTGLSFALRECKGGAP